MSWNCLWSAYFSAPNHQNYSLDALPPTARAKMIRLCGARRRCRRRCRAENSFMSRDNHSGGTTSCCDQFAGNCYCCLCSRRGSPARARCQLTSLWLAALRATFLLPAEVVACARTLARLLHARCTTPTNRYTGRPLNSTRMLID